MPQPLHLHQGAYLLVNHHQLTALSQRLRCQVHGLNLLDCRSTSRSVISAWVCSLGDALRSLKCPLLTTDCLIAISEHCHHLETLETHSSGHAIIGLCVANARSLRSLRLSGLSRETAHQLAKVCTNLVYCHGLMGAIGIIPLYCPMMKVVDSDAMEIRLMVNSQGRRCVDIIQRAEHTVNSHTALLAAIPLPIRTCKIYLRNQPDAVSALKCLGEKFGNTLEAIDLDLDFASTGDCLTELLQHCPNLIAFALTPRTDSMLTAQLPVLCRKLKKIDLGGGGGFLRMNQADAYIAPLLAAFIGSPSNTVAELVLPVTLMPTEVTLNAIAAAFPRLSKFISLNKHFMDTDRAADRLALLGHIVTRRLTVKKFVMHCVVASWVYSALGKQGLKIKFYKEQDLFCVCFPPN